MTQSGRRKGSNGAKPLGEKYIFRLFVAGDEPNSAQAKENLQKTCEEHLKRDYKIEIVDVLVDFETAIENKVLVTPMVIIISPPPPVSIIGLSVTSTPPTCSASVDRRSSIQATRKDAASASRTCAAANWCGSTREAGSS